MKSDNISKFTLRIDKKLLKKFRYAADYNDRSANREIITLIKEYVLKFEKENGNIEDLE